MNIIKPFLATFLMTQSDPKRRYVQIISVQTAAKTITVSDTVHEIEADLTDACIADAISENPNYTLARMKGGTIVLMEYQLVTNPTMRLAVDRFTFTGAEGVTAHGDPVPVMDDPRLRACFWDIRYGSDLKWEEFIIPQAQQAKLDAIPGWDLPQHQQLAETSRSAAHLGEERDAPIRCNQREASPGIARKQGQAQASAAGAVHVVPRQPRAVQTAAAAVPVRVVAPQQPRAQQIAAPVRVVAPQQPRAQQIVAPVPIVPPQQPRAQQDSVPAPVVTAQASPRPPVSKVVPAVVSHMLSPVSSKAPTSQSRERPAVQQPEDHSQPRKTHTTSSHGASAPYPDKDQPPARSPAISSMSGKRSAASALGFNLAQLRVLKKLALNLRPTSTNPTTPGGMREDLITQNKDSTAQDKDPHPSATEICKAAAERQLRKARKPLQKIRDVRKASEKSKSNTQRKQRVRWTLEEVTQLEEGVKRFGVGRWTDILGTGKFDSVRSTMDLKDKWRNIRLAKNQTNLP